MTKPLDSVDDIRAENTKLKDRVQNLDAEVRELRKQIVDKDSEIASISEDLAEAKEEQLRAGEIAETEAAEAIDRFLDEVQRPTGSLAFTIPHGGPTDRAILGLYDVIGRKL